MTSDITRSLVLQGVVITYSLTAGAFHSNPPSLLGEPVGLLRLAIALAAGMLGVWMRDRSSHGRERSPHSVVLDMVVIYGLVAVSQVPLVWLAPELILSNWAPTQGGFVGGLLFAATRALFGGTPPDAVTEETSQRLRTACRIGAWIALTVILPGSLMLLSGSKVYLYWIPVVVLICAEALIRAAAAQRTSAQPGIDTVVR